MLGLAIVLQAGAGLEGKGNGFEVTSFAREHRVPFRLLSDLTRLLVNRKWLAEVADQPGHYVLLKAPEKIHLKDVMDAVMEQGSSPKALGLDGLGPEVKLLAERIEQGLQESLSSETVADFLHAS
jgi:DNA-binding IscR family transcriptional regulator